MVVVVAAEFLSEDLKRRLGEERTAYGEPIVAHCGETLRILADLGVAGVGPGQTLELLMWATAALPLMGPADVERCAGPQTLVLATALRSLLQLQSLKLQDGKSALAERERVRQMFFEMSRDPKLVLLSLASRLQSLRFHALAGMTPEPDSCTFTLQILAPLANRLGLGRLKWELEDLAFRFASPQRYRAIASALDEKRSQREAFIEGLVSELRQALRRLGLDPRVSGRPKNIYSIHQKMESKAVGFERLLDLRACRVIVSSVDACYLALDWVHQRFTPLLAEFDDYIARPKPNGYRSLHTVVLHEDGRPVEVQIRTQAMDQEAELGLASHWDYKELSTGLRRATRSGSDREQIAYVRHLLAWQQEIAQGPLEGPARKTIFVLTPMGKVLELPVGATPLDFAYSIHTELGHRCRGARVDEVMVPLNTPLRSGQTVEIVAAKHASQRTDSASAQAFASGGEPDRRRGPANFRRDAGELSVAGQRTPEAASRLPGAGSGANAARIGDRLGPSRDWLNPKLGYLRTSRARAKVRQWFQTLDEDRDQAIGRARLMRILRRESSMGVSLEALARRLKFQQPRELFIAFARDELSVRALDQSLREARGEARAEAALAEDGSAAPRSRSARARSAPRESGVLVEGVGALMTQVARCCKPVPPEAIVGFVTRGNGVSVHRRECETLARLLARHPERQIGTQWAAR